MATAADSDARIERWTRTERALHWVHAAAFCVLLGSGLCLYLPSLSELVSRRPLLKHIHIYTAAAWAVAIVLLLIAGNRRTLRSTLRELDTLDPNGRMNRGQQLNTIVTVAFAILFSVSGFLLWYGERDTRFRFAGTLLVHDWLMYVAFVLFLGHLYYALILPSTRHSLNGMTRGWVREEWAARRHPGWVAALRSDD
ncbi:MAG TPA: cytochrome b/b6 domain-containing protein [Gaiellaceae bacterium]